MAEYERSGAALERWWAELVDSTTPNSTTRAAERARADAAEWLKASESPTH
jgi:hypothetical protein